MGSMSYLKLKHFLFLLVLLVSCVLYSWRTVNDDKAKPKPKPKPKAPPPPPPGYDYFLLALTWPNGFCSNKTCNPSPPEQQYFTVHGLWPQNSTGQQPNYCTTTEVLTDAILKGLENDLLKYWPNLSNAKDFDKSKGFWRHEWTKHGTCSANKFPPKEYFEHGIALGKGYGQKILTDLGAQGIKPDNTKEHSTADVLEAIKKGTNKTARISCTTNKNNKLQLSEVRLCFNDDGKTLKDCTRGSSASCSANFIFPSTTTSSWISFNSHSFPELGSSMWEGEEAAEL